MGRLPTSSEHGMRRFDSKRAQVFLCERLEVSLSQRLVRGEGRTPKITVTKSARFDDLEILSPSNQQGPGTGASVENASPPTAGLRKVY